MEATLKLRTEQRADGLLLATVAPEGVWAAIRALRAAMGTLGGGSGARCASLTGIAADGRIVAAPDAEVLVLQYRIETAAPMG